MREVILYNGEFLTIEQGETLFSEASSDITYMYLILSGEAEAFIQHPTHAEERIVFARLSSGDEAGEISVVTEKPRTVTVVATSRLRLLAMKTESIQAWRRRYSDFEQALRNHVQRKLQHNLEAIRLGK